MIYNSVNKSRKNVMKKMNYKSKFITLVLLSSILFSNVFFLNGMVFQDDNTISKELPENRELMMPEASVTLSVSVSPTSASIEKGNTQTFRFGLTSDEDMNHGDWWIKIDGGDWIPQVSWSLDYVPMAEIYFKSVYYTTEASLSVGNHGVHARFYHDDCGYAYKDVNIEITPISLSVIVNPESVTKYYGNTQTFEYTLSALSDINSGWWEIKIDGGPWTPQGPWSLDPYSYYYRDILHYTTISTLHIGTHDVYAQFYHPDCGYVYEHATINVAPLPPTNVAPTEYPCYDGTTIITWTKSSGATKYQLYEATTPGGTYTAIGSVLGDVSITSVSKSSEQTRYYRVIAGRDNAWSELSTNSASVTWSKPPTPIISSPVTQTIYTHSSFSVTRDSVISEVDEFDWEISIDGGEYEEWSSSSLSSLSYDPPAGDHTYQFRLRVRNINFGVWSDYGYSGIITVSNPSSPMNFQVSEETCYDGSVTFSWTATTGATSYTLYEATTVDGEYAAIITGITELSTTVSKSAEETRYYKLKAVNDVGDSDFSSFVEVSWSAPETPTITSPITQTVYTHSSFSVTRDSVGSYVDEFDWEISIDGGAYIEWSTSSLDTLSYDPSEGDHTYQFRLRVRNANFGVWSDYSYSGILTVSTFSTPLNVQTSESICYDGSVIISWDAVVGATNYTLYEATTVDGEYTAIFTDIIETSINVSKTTNGTRHYKVKAINEVGESDFSDYVSVSWSAPESPTITSPITQTVDDHSPFSVTRDSVGSYVDEFDWEISIDGGTYTDWNTSELNTLSYDPADEDHTYQFRLRVRNSEFGIWSDYGYSGIHTIIIPDTTSPLIDSPPDVTYVYNTIGHNITWSVSDSNPYQYQLFIDGVGQGINTWDGNDLTISIDGLSIGEHNVTLWVSDIEGNWAEDQVNVTVEKENNIPGYEIGSLSAVFLISIIVSIFVVKRKR